jgi:hypothetical protein
MEIGEATGRYLMKHKYYVVDRRHSHPNNWKASKTDRENVPVYESRHPKSKLFYIYTRGVIMNMILVEHLKLRIKFLKNIRYED